MSWFSDLFSSNQQTTSNSQNTSTTQNNLWNNPFLQNYMGAYASQYSPGMINSVQAPPNAFMYNSANYSQGLAPGLSGAMNTAANVANYGITPADIQAFQSPYTQQVVDNTINAYSNMDKQAFENLNSKRASQFALGNNTSGRAENLYYQGVNPQRQREISGLYDQGFRQAADNAFKNAGIQLTGAGLQGQLTGVQGQVNQQAFNQGDAIRQALLQNQLLPFQLYNQGLQGFGQLGNLAGSTTNSSGTSNSNTTSTPSLAQGIAGLAGMAFGIPGMGGFGGWGDMFSTNNWGANLGMIPYGSFAQGGAVIPAYQDGGGADNVFARYGKALQAVQGIQGRPFGGRVGINDVPSLGSFTDDGSGDDDVSYPAGGWTPGSGPAFPMFQPPQQPQRSASAISQPPMPTPTQGGLAAMGAPGGAGPIAPMGGGPQMPPDAAAGAGAGPAGGGAGGPGAAQNDAALGASIQQGLTQMPEPVQPMNWMQNLGAMLLKASGPQVFGPAADAIYAQQKDKRDTYAAQIEAYERAQKAKQWAAEQDRLAEQMKLQRDQFGLQRDQFAETKLNSSPIRALNEQKLFDLQNPEAVYERRRKQANALQMDPASREYREFVATGDFPKSATAKDSLLVQAEERRVLAKQLGLAEGSPAYNTFIATGRMGRDETMTSGDRTKVVEAEKEITDYDVAIKNLERALALNDKAYAHTGAGVRAGLKNMFPYTADEASKATRELSDILSQEAITQMSQTLKGASTDREMFKFIEMAGDVSLPADVRKQYLSKAIEKMKMHRRTAKRIADGIRDGTFYRAPITPKAISQMTMDGLKALDLDLLDDQALEAAAKRMRELEAAGAPLP